MEKFKEHLPASIVPDPIVEKIESIYTANAIPNVAVIIHGKNAEKIIDCAVNLRSKTTYPNYRIIACYSDYDDITIKKNEIINEVVETTIDNYSANSNKIVSEHLTPEDEIVVFMTENSLIQNDVISLGVKSLMKNKNCGSVTARIYNADKTLHNNGYEVWNIVRPSAKEGEKPQSSLLVNLVGNGGYYSFRNEHIFDTIGGTKEFFMVKTDVYRKIRFNESYKKAFQDLEFNLRCINDQRTNIVLGNGVVQLRETIVSDPDFNDDLNKVFLPYVYSQELSAIDKHIKNYMVPAKDDK